MRISFRHWIAGLALAAAADANAATISSWDHTGQPGNQVSTPGIGSPNVTAAALVRGPGLAPSAAANSISSTGWDGTDAGDYFELAFSVDAGYAVALDSLILGTRSSATGPGTIGVYSSLDAFTTPIVSIVQPNATFANSIINLSSLGSVSGSFAIRLIEIGNTQASGVGATAGTGTFRVGDYYDGSVFTDTQITGTTALIPEPVTGLLLAGGLLVIGAARRR